MCFAHPDGRKIHRYKTTVSTGNLLSHLSEEHNIKPTCSVEKSTIKKFFQAYTQSPELSKSSKVTDNRKIILSDKMTIWFCRDLIPFFEAEKEGLRDFLKSCGVVESTIPCSTTLSRNSLSRIYDDCVLAVKSKINQDNSSAVSITMDAWTDNYRHLPYMTFTLHWISSSETQLKSCTLQTSFFPHPHTADNIVEELKKVLINFNLNDKIVILVTDGGRNMVKAANDMKLNRIPCVAHGLHNLIMTDTLSNLPEVTNIIVKARAIIKMLAFKTQELQTIKEAIQQQAINDILDHAENLEELLEADTRFSISTTKVNNEHSYVQKFPSSETSSIGLHKDVPTRWNSTLEMLTSLLKNKGTLFFILMHILFIPFKLS